MKLKVSRWVLLVVAMGGGLAAASSVRVIPYQYGQVYTLSLSPLYVTSIHFQGVKAVSSVHCGDSSAWEVLRSGVSKNTILIKPKLANSETDLIVKAGKTPVLFKIRSLTRKIDSPLIYVNVILSQQKPSPSKKRGGYHAYCFQGDPSLKPLWMYDNGSTTYFSWRRNRGLPAVYRVSTDLKQRYMTNFRVHKRVFLLPRVNSKWLLKRGRHEAMLTRVTGRRCRG